MSPKTKTNTKMKHFQRAAAGNHPNNWPTVREQSQMFGDSDEALVRRYSEQAQFDRSSKD